ncbi:MAG: ABC transporter permease [Armatimonadetes bacterium]|nr:ABC transporter permease [Armatimonadota bacterium]
MTAFILRRLLLVLPVLLGVSILVFFILHLTPGNPALVVAGPDAPPETIRQVERELGLDQPLFVQYTRYLGRILRGDFGRSIRSRDPVLERLIATFPVTLTLALIGVAFTTSVSIPMGILAAYRRNSALDVATIFLVLTGSAMPVFAVGLILMWVFAVTLGWFPISGYAPLTSAGGWRHIILPAITVSSGTIALLARLTRSSMLEVLNQDYVRTARAKGVGERPVVLRHAFRNALLPVVTVIGLQFGFLLSGAVVTESIFSLPGMGRLLVQAILGRDFPVVQGAVLLAAVTFVITNLLVDMVYAAVDPRIRYE